MERCKRKSLTMGTIGLAVLVVFAVVVAGKVIGSWLDRI
jgi:hypothetical protein